jgi:eukaryotic-like serine/threonine-protein kinase
MRSRIVFALLVAAALIAAPGSASTSSHMWPQFHYDAAHTGFNPNETRLKPGNVGRLEQAWSSPTGGPVETSSAVSADGLLYIGTENSIFRAFDAGNGVERWSVSLGSESRFVASAAVVGGRVFEYSSSSIMRAFGAESGDPEWSRSISELKGGFPGSPTIWNGLVYALPYELVALDQQTGSVRWIRPNVGCFACSPAIADGILYVGGGPAVGKQFLTLDAETGAQRWAFKPQAGRHFGWNASPSVRGGRVYQAAFVASPNTKQYSLYAFSASSGARLWKVLLGKSNVLTASSPAVANGVVYYASPGGRLYALKTRSGRVLWSREIGLTDSSPAIANGVVYIGAGHAVWAFEARHGKRLWRVTVGGDASSPAVVDGSVYVGTSDGRLHAYRLKPGG